MALTEKDVRYVADLAHLKLTEEEVAKFLPQIDSILNYMQKLNQLDTTQVQPMTQVTYPSVENPSVRADASTPGFSQQEALSGAPDPADEYFRVPRAIEKE